MPNDEEMKEMSLDDYTAWMIDNGWYDIDLQTGTVSNSRTGKTLNAFVNSTGYRGVNLVFSRKVVRRVLVHRMIAIKHYGIDAVMGKHIAHLDSNRLNNDVTNLSPMTASEHVKYDGTDRNLTHRAARKETWEPCVRCGDSDGPTAAITPERIDGKRFGIDGDICRRCYGALQERERRKKKSDESKCHGDILACVADMTPEERRQWSGAK